MKIIPFCYRSGDEAFADAMRGTYFTWFDSHDIATPGTWTAWVMRDEAGAIAGWSHLEPFNLMRKAHVARVGVAVRPDVQAKGWGTQLVAHVVKSAWKRGYTKLWATYHAPNVAAGRVFGKNGFLPEGIFRDEERWGGTPTDIVSVARFADGK